MRAGFNRRPTTQDTKAAGAQHPGTDVRFGMVNGLLRYRSDPEDFAGLAIDVARFSALSRPIEFAKPLQQNDFPTWHGGCNPP